MKNECKEVVENQNLKKYSKNTKREEVITAKGPFL